MAAPRRAVALAVGLLGACHTAAAIPANVLCDSKLLAYDFAAELLPERAAKAGGLAPVALGLGVDPANKSCTDTHGGGGGGGHHPSPPGPPPPPKPPVPHGSCSALLPGMSLVYVSRAFARARALAGCTDA
jgi:hypothetical protein